MEKIVFYKLRIIFVIIGWINIFIDQYLSCTGINGCMFMYRTFTIQSNLLVILWLTLAVLLGDLTEREDERMSKLKGPIRTAITVYISVTFIVFVTLLEKYYNPTGLEELTNIIEHYIIPLYFIIDWVFTEYKELDMKNIAYFLIYPLLYLLFNQILGYYDHKYIYPFLNLPVLGLTAFIIWVIILLLVFVIISYIYIRLIPTKKDKISILKE